MLGSRRRTERYCYDGSCHGR